MIVSTGGTPVTVSAALLLVALPATLLTTARKTAPVSVVAVVASEYVAEVAPTMSLPSRCHW
ncbi:hypothetical protein [Ideonella azotifigens]|uniref:hypothetical protein n=1 Tax=Ideonella azotifigens TaxID=513160 RepID=UPI0011435A92|nr:hypothetical protein [Ideonella azotifigens]